jgi:hypothetical protein
MNKTTIATFIIFFLLPGCYHYYDSLNELTIAYPEEVQTMYDYCVDKWGEDSCPEINLFLKQHQERRVYTNYFLFNGEIFAHEIYEDCVATFSTSTCPSLISYQERNLPDGAICSRNYLSLGRAGCSRNNDVCCLLQPRRLLQNCKPTQTTHKARTTASSRRISKCVS